MLVLLDALIDGMKLARRALPLIERPVYGPLSGRYVTRPSGRGAKAQEPGTEDTPEATPPKAPEG